MFTENELLSISDLCAKQGVLILSDEVYERVNHNPVFTRIASLRPDIAQITLTVGCIGKMFNATGWHLGFVIAAVKSIESIRRANLLLPYSTEAPPQQAGAIGFERPNATGF